jgi:hypothetical protein
MKKVGLVCNYYILNYGSALQCYATEKTIKEMGYEVEAIKFSNIPTTKAKMQLILKLKLKQLFKPKAILAKLRRIKDNSTNHLYAEILKNRKYKFTQFINENMMFSKEIHQFEELHNFVEKYDTVILGSDQLLNPKDIIFGYHTLSFVPDNICKVSYAASFGLSKLPISVKSKAQKELSRFDSFSAREIRGAEIYKELTGKKVPVVVDPTLLLSRTEWDEISGSEPIVKDRYIYCYFIGLNEMHRNIAKRLAEITGYKIVSIRHIDEYIKEDENFGDIAINDAGPSEFVNIVKNAEIILADSFHATIFSVIFNKRFFVLNRFANNSSQSTNSRIDSLLEILNLEDRRIANVEDVENRYNDTIDYQKVNEILKNWSGESKEYLKNSLN